MGALRLALIGDVHCAWGPEDVAYFDGTPRPYDAVLFTGDLPGMRHKRAYDVAAAIGRLRTPAYLMPGNHDGASLGELIADIAGLSQNNPLLARAMTKRVARLADVLGDVALVGYSHHRLGPDGVADADAVGLIAVRPHSQGGGFNYGPYIERAFGLTSIQASAARLRALIDECPCRRLVFLGHNGPHGLGGAKNDMFGADFRRDGGDWGDIDMRDAIDYAVRSGRRVLAVVAGHMHHRTKQKQQRPWKLERDGVLYLNVARVPRVFRDHAARQAGAMKRYHVALAIDGDQAEATEVAV